MPATLAIRVRAKAQPKGERPPKGVRFPSHEPLRKALAAHFRAQRVYVLSRLDTLGPRWLAGVKAEPVPIEWDDDTDDLAFLRRVFPRLSALWDDAGERKTKELNRVRIKAGLDPNPWDVRDPNVKGAIETAALDLARSSRETTELEIGEALAALRRTLSEGIADRGEAMLALRKRVQGVFTRAEKSRADTIARTETIRAVHAGQLESDRQSGVVIGYRWLPSTAACPLCMEMAGSRPVRIGQQFATFGTHPTYSRIMHPPLHPRCQCSLTAILDPKLTGEKAPKWADKPLDFSGAPKPKPKPEPERRERPRPRPESAPPVPPEPPADPVAAAVESGRRRIAEAAAEQRRRNADEAKRRTDPDEMARRSPDYQEAVARLARIEAKPLDERQTITWARLRQHVLTDIEHLRQQLVKQVDRDYADALATTPNLIPAGEIADRLKAYEGVAKAKLDAIAEVGRQVRQEVRDLHNRIDATWAEMNAQVDKLAKAEAAGRKFPKRVTDRIAELENQINDLKARIDRDEIRVQDAVASILEVDRPVLVGSREPTPGNTLGDHSGLDPLSGPSLGRAKDAMRWLSRVVARGDARDLKEPIVGTANGVRAYCRTWGTEAHIQMDIHNGTKIYVHEFGHWLDAHLATAKRQPGDVAQQFLDYRVGGEQPVAFDSLFTGFRPDEKGRKDRFDRYFKERSAYYTGKDYGSRGLTEITSMGLEALYDDPVGFCEKDPEYASFVLGYLDGSLR